MQGTGKRLEVSREYNEAKNKGLLKELQEKSNKYDISVILDHILVPGVKKPVTEIKIAEIIPARD